MNQDSENPCDDETQALSQDSTSTFLECFGPYNLLEQVGRGGMGVVYRAYDMLRQREVALKMPRQDLFDLRGMLARFYREARLAARLAHPGLCPVLDVGEHDGVHYLSMPFIRGTRLSDCRIDDPLAAVLLVRQLAFALAEAHRLNIIHRDLKPSNVLITPAGDPIVVDFGLAVCLSDDQDRLTRPGMMIGTRGYMPPEQMTGELELFGPWSDVYSLGAILYFLFTEDLPPDPFIGGKLIPPSQRRSGIDPRCDAICLSALAVRIEERFRSMDDLADALGDLMGLTRPGRVRPPVAAEAVRFAFTGMGESAPQAMPGDRIYLDVGNDLRPGVLDHHHLTSGSGSTASLVLSYPVFLERALASGRQPGDPLTLVMHQEPDLDSIASAYLTREYLVTGSFPPGANQLACYVDEFDSGSPSLSPDNPFALYSAYFILSDRLLKQSWNSPHQRWQAQARAGMDLIGFVLSQASRLSAPLSSIDAFACPGMFRDEDRQQISLDLERYRQKLADPQTHACQARLRLPGRYGDSEEVDALLVRDVQGAEDPRRCIFFKHWARTDPQSPNGKGFVGLSVFSPETSRSNRRCILSVPPNRGVALRGLGALLDRAEGARRKEVLGVDDRAVDATTGQPRPPRPGYDNADPWYDGRAHDFTIVDSPRSGTWLTAEEIESIFLRFGGKELDTPAPQECAPEK